MLEFKAKKYQTHINKSGTDINTMKELKQKLGSPPGDNYLTISTKLGSL